MQLVADDTKNLEPLLTFSFGLHTRTGCISIILGYRQRGEEQSLLQRWCPFSQTSILKIFRHSLFEEYIFQKHVFANVFFIQVDNRLVKRKLEKIKKKEENSQRKAVKRHRDKASWMLSLLSLLMGHTECSWRLWSMELEPEFKACTWSSYLVVWLVMLGAILKTWPSNGPHP